MPRQFTSSLQIDVPPERLVDTLTNFNTWSDWMPGLVKVEVLSSGSPGPFGVGTRWRETRKMFGREAAEEFEVTAFDHPRHIELLVDGAKGSTGKGSYHFDYRFLPESGGTRVELTGTVDIPGLGFRLFGGLLIGTFRKACDRDMQALGAFVRAEQDADHAA